MASKLDELRSILVGPDHDKLDEISLRIERAERRAVDVAEVLPESVTRSFEHDPRLTVALRGPLRQCVSESVREDPQEYADALFPIMGPAIRRAVAEALKAWLQQANHAIEQSLSPRGLKWRFQAWRAGIPYGEYVLQRTLLYRVEHVYLIHAPSGLLMGHVYQADAVAKDEDAVSAMFTAIQDFVQDSFARTERLSTAELGELTLWAAYAPSCILVAVVQGTPPAAFRHALEAALERLELEHGSALQDYEGDRAALPELGASLERCLVSSSLEPVDGHGGPSALVVAGCLVGVALLAWWGRAAWLDLRADRVASVLEEVPGIVVTQIERRGRALRVRGLRDPSTPSVESLAFEAGWRGGVDAALEPYFSLEPEIVLARARAQLIPPSGVTLSMRGGDTLVISGAASPDWIASARAASVLGVARVDSSGLLADSAALRERISELEDMVSSTVVRFALGEAELLAGTEDLEMLLPALREYAELAQRLGVVPRVWLTGHSEPTGPQALNRRLESSRAAAVAAALIRLGAEPEWLATVSQLESGVSGVRVPAVTIRLETGDATDNSP